MRLSIFYSSFLLGLHEILFLLDDCWGRPSEDAAECIVQGIGQDIAQVAPNADLQIPHTTIGFRTWVQRLENRTIYCNFLIREL